MEKNKPFNRTVTIFMIACIISNISYYPVFQRSNYARTTVLIFWTIITVWTIVNQRYLLIRNDAFMDQLFLYGCFVLCSFITFLNGHVNVFNNNFFFPVTVATVILFVSYICSEKIERLGLKKICLTYMHIVNLLSLLLYFFYLRGTNIVTAYYGYSYGKNEIAVLILCASVFSLLVYEPTNTIGKTYKILGIGTGFLDVALLRCRTVLVGYAILYLILIVRLRKIKPHLKKILILLGIIAVIYFGLNQNIWKIVESNIIFAGRDRGVDSLSSGRLTQIKNGLEVFFNNIFTGVGNRETLDCFYISSLANYGLGAWTIICMALSPIIWGIRNSLKHDADELDLCFLAIALSLFVVSCFEELAPFGPGTRCYILWLMWGVMLKCKSYNKKEIRNSYEDN